MSSLCSLPSKSWFRRASHPPFLPGYLHDQHEYPYPGTSPGPSITLLSSLPSLFDGDFKPYLQSPPCPHIQHPCSFALSSPTLLSNSHPRLSTPHCLLHTSLRIQRGKIYKCKDWYQQKFIVNKLKWTPRKKNLIKAIWHGARHVCLIVILRSLLFSLFLFFPPSPFPSLFSNNHNNLSSSLTWCFSNFYLEVSTRGRQLYEKERDDHPSSSGPQKHWGPWAASAQAAVGGNTSKKSCQLKVFYWMEDLQKPSNRTIGLLCPLGKPLRQDQPRVKTTRWGLK